MVDPALLEVSHFNANMSPYLRLPVILRKCQMESTERRALDDMFIRDDDWYVVFPIIKATKEESCSCTQAV